MLTALDLAPSDNGEEDSEFEEPQQETLAEALGIKDEEVSITKSLK